MEEEEGVVAVEATVVVAAMVAVEVDEVVEDMTRDTVVEEEDTVVEDLVEAVVAVDTKQLFATFISVLPSPYMGHCAWVQCLS